MNNRESVLELLDFILSVDDENVNEECLADELSKEEILQYLNMTISNYYDCIALCLIQEEYEIASKCHKLIDNKIKSVNKYFKNNYQDMELEYLLDEVVLINEINKLKISIYE